MPVDKSPSTKQRMRIEISEAIGDLRRRGAIDATQCEKTTLAMLGRDAFPKAPPLTPAEIVRLREKIGVSQSVLAGFLNIATNTLSQWERGERKPTGAALKLLHVVKNKGLDVVK